MSVTAAPKRGTSEEGEVEIRLSDIIQFFKESYRRILLCALAGLVIGIIYAFSKPNLYTSQVTVMPEIQDKGAGGLGSLGSLAGLAGINVGTVGASDAVRPDLYPNVLQSVPFALSMLKQTVYSANLQAAMPLQEFIKKTYSGGIVSTIMGFFSGGGGNNTERVEKKDPKNFSQAIQVTKEQEGLIKLVQATITTTYDRKTGILSISAVEPDPVVSATAARLALEYLTNYVTTYRTEKARKQVVFLRQQVSEAKGRYQTAEYALSEYRDKNRSLYLNTAKIDEQRLQADYVLTQSVYSELSKQLEQAKIKVQEETPVFKLLEPPTVPLEKSGPKRTLIVIGFAIVGAVIGFGVLLIRRVVDRHSNSVI